MMDLHPLILVEETWESEQRLLDTSLMSKEMFELRELSMQMQMVQNTFSEVMMLHFMLGSEILRL